MFCHFGIQVVNCIVKQESIKIVLFVISSHCSKVNTVSLGFVLKHIYMLLLKLPILLKFVLNDRLGLNYVKLELPQALAPILHVLHVNLLLFKELRSAHSEQLLQLNFVVYRYFGVLDCVQVPITILCYHKLCSCR
jgi:hypothetical protein